MARSRNLKPGFFKNELLAELPPLTRILFEGLWCWADRDGRLEDRPKRLKSEILPYDDVDVDAALDTLAGGEDPFILRYEVEGQRYIQVVKFRDHQSPHNSEKPSAIPVFPEYSESAPSVVQPAIKGIRNQETGISNRESGISNSSRKGEARGKPKFSSEDVPVPPNLDTPGVRAAIDEWLLYKAKRGEAYTDPSYIGRKIAEFEAVGPEVFIGAVNSSIGNNWAGLFAAKTVGNHHAGDPRGNRAVLERFVGKQRG